LHISPPKYLNFAAGTHHFDTNFSTSKGDQKPTYLDNKLHTFQKGDQVSSGVLKPIYSKGHSLISLCRGPYKYLYGRAPYKSTKIDDNRAACGGCGSLAARVADTCRQKSLNCPPQKKRRLRRISEVQPDLQGSLIVPPTVKSSCAGLNELRARERYDILKDRRIRQFGRPTTKVHSG
jgi:hypothetical protein